MNVIHGMRHTGNVKDHQSSHNGILGVGADGGTTHQATDATDGVQVRAHQATDGSELLVALLMKSSCKSKAANCKDALAGSHCVQLY